MAVRAKVLLKVSENSFVLITCGACPTLINLRVSLCNGASVHKKATARHLLLGRSFSCFISADFYESSWLFKKNLKSCCAFRYHMDKIPSCCTIISNQRKCWSVYRMFYLKKKQDFMLTSEHWLCCPSESVCWCRSWMCEWHALLTDI